jgi:ATP-dependent Lon protease
MDVHDQPMTVLPLRGFVLFPGMITPIFLHHDGSIRAIEAAATQGQAVLFVAQRNSDLEHPTSTDLHRVGTLGRVLRVMRFPEGELRILAEGLARVRVTRFSSDHPSFQAQSRPLRSTHRNGLRVQALAEHLRSAFQSYLEVAARTPPELDLVLGQLNEPERLADYVAGNLPLEVEKAQDLLALSSVESRLQAVLDAVEYERELAQLNASIHARVQNAMDQNQREYYLKEQIKVLREELGELDPGAADRKLFRERLEGRELPEVVITEVGRQLERLSRMHPETAEYGVARTYLDWLTTMPWAEVSGDNDDLAAVQQVLDDDHHGLDKVKERIIEYLAVRQLNPMRKGPILCFVGPPGVGKTSLGRSIARALGRKFGRVSLGGVKDESEIRGHRRTYVGSLPGRIIQEIHRAQSRNPVMVLDEIDKVGNDFRGDPASALLEVLDPEQNHTYMDHYLDLPFDLSQVMFVCTANVPDTIPSALLDRMELIELPGYSQEEKLEIAKRHLVPRQIKEHGLTTRTVRFGKLVLKKLVSGYTNEAGVRQLEREIASLCRKVARDVVSGNRGLHKVQPSDLAELLGPERHEADLVERSNLPGIAVGLAWTTTGGDILFIEASQMPGAKQFRITGQLGGVMRESAETALAYVRSRAADLGIDPGFFKESDIHLHVPAGAVPKDGPSAGITLATALASLLSGRRVRPSLAMTGEITLRGKVLGVGGLKDKLLAARRAGVREVVLPRKNSKDLSEVPDYVRNALHIHFVDTVEQAMAIALEPAKPTRSRRASSARMAARSRRA